MEIRVPRVKRLGRGSKAGQTDSWTDRQTETARGWWRKRRGAVPGARCRCRGRAGFGHFSPKNPTRLGRRGADGGAGDPRCPLAASRRLLVAAPWDGDGQGDVYKCRVGPPNATCDKANLGTAV